MSQERALGPHIVMRHHHGPTVPPLPTAQVQQISPEELTAHLRAVICAGMLSACSGPGLWPCLSAATTHFSSDHPLLSQHGDKLWVTTWLM